MDVPPEALRARQRPAPAPSKSVEPAAQAPAVAPAPRSGEPVASQAGAQSERGPRPEGTDSDSRQDWRRPENRRGHARRGGRRRNRQREDGDQGAGRPDSGAALPADGFAPRAPDGELREGGVVPDQLRRDHPEQGEMFNATRDGQADRQRAFEGRPGPDGGQPGFAGERGGENFGTDRDRQGNEGGGEFSDRGGRFGRRRRRRRGGPAGAQPGGGNAPGFQGEPRAQHQQQRPGQQFGGQRPQQQHAPAAPVHQAAPEPQQETVGMFIADKGATGFLRSPERQFLPSKDDVFVPPHVVARHKLRDGAMVRGPLQRGQGQSPWQLADVIEVDGKPSRDVAGIVSYKKLVSIDPDFHYELGNQTGDVSLKILDLICPIGRGTRGLLVAPPRSGKTILMQKFACGIQEHYTDVQLFVLLVDERPEEATEWKRIIKPPGMVFVSTNDERADNHVALCEAVWARATRLVELGQDVVLVLDSITRMARSYNNVLGNSGKTMSGGLDTRAMERPKQFFGSARNTETAGSLTILGTTLVETGSRMDQVIFEEFKGTGNMELVLSRKLADRRIFPSIDIEKSGTRKEEKLLSARRLKQIQILRRVLLKMNFVEAMELLITKLEDVDDIDVFLKRFEVDPDK